MPSSGGRARRGDGRRGHEPPVRSRGVDEEQRAIDRPAQATQLAPRIRSEDLLAPVRPKLLLGYFDLAIAGALDYVRNAGVYVAPWWDLPSAGAGEEVVGWKRAVLLRQVERGGLHLGHLFLVVLVGGRRLSLRREDLSRWGAAPGPVETREIVMRTGDPQLLLITRPTYADTAERLQVFAEDVAERFRLQID